MNGCWLVEIVFVTGARGRGRGKKTWEECVKLESCGLMEEAALDRNAWRGLVVEKRPTRASMDNRALN